MRKIIALLLALMLLCCGAQALTGSGYPAPDGSQTLTDAFTGSVGGVDVQMNFDGSDKYSYFEDGNMQLCFFAFDAAEENYLELYLVLPEDVISGEVLTEASGAGVVLYEVYSDDSETCFFCMDGFPPEANFSMTIGEVIREGGSVSVAGTLNAHLAVLKDEQPTGDFLEITGAKFQCTLGGAAQPAPTQEPQDPQGAQEPQSELPESPDLPELPEDPFNPFLPEVPKTNSGVTDVFTPQSKDTVKL